MAPVAKWDRGIPGCGALAYACTRITARLVLSPLAGLTASWLINTVALSAYWHGPRVPARHASFYWGETAVPMVIAWAVVAALLLVPVVLGLLRRGVHARRTA